MSATRSRILLVGFGALLGALLAAPLLRRRHQYEGAVFADGACDIEVVLRERASRPPASQAAQGERLVREPIDEATARRLFHNLRSSQLVYDPYVYFVRRPHLSIDVPMKEHPRGHWLLATNSLGLRDREPGDGRPDLRIVVTGDSHVEGVCDNEDSFPNLLERLLGERFPDASFDVINAGQGGYAFYQYLGMLERLAFLEPDVFVLVCYGGNDFRGTLLPWHYFHHTVLPIGRPEDTKRLHGARDIDRNAVAQFLYQAAYFRRHPDQVPLASRGAVEVTQEVARRCGEIGARLVCVYLPSAVEVRPDAYWPDEAAGAMGVTREDFVLVGRLADDWLAACRSLGAEVLDLRPVFAAEEEDLYWHTDYHVNLRGHRLIAAALLPVLARIHESRRARALRDEK